MKSARGLGQLGAKFCGDALGVLAPLWVGRALFFADGIQIKSDFSGIVLALDDAFSRIGWGERQLSVGGNGEAEDASSLVVDVSAERADSIRRNDHPHVVAATCLDPFFARHFDIHNSLPAIESRLRIAPQI